MTREEFLEKLKTKEIRNGRVSIQKNAPEIAADIVEYFGENFGQKLYNYIHNITTNPKCQADDCQQDVYFLNTSYGYVTYCCKTCKDLMLSKIKLNYSVDSKALINKKRSETNILKYGVDNIAKLNNIQEKIKNTNLEKYGTVAPTQNKDVLKLREANNLKKWGVKYLTQIPTHVDKIKVKRLKTENQKIFDKYQALGLKVISFEDKMITCFCDTCQQEYTTNLYIVYQRHKNNLETCTHCCPIGDLNTSQFEKAVYTYIQELLPDLEILKTERNVLNNKRELDIYIPALKIAIECNGVFWHCEAKVNKNYHRNKYLMCLEKDIKLIQIWQDDWTYKQDIVKSRLQSIFNKNFKIMARKCQLKEVSFQDSKEFLNNNHLQGFVPSKINYGLYYQTELVAIMTFANKRIAVGNKYDHEILRFCTKLNTNVLGAANKLFKHYIKIHQPNNILTYANLEWGSGSFYSKLGFNRLKDTSIGYTYLVDSIRRHRFNYTKQKLIKQGFDANKTEHEIMLDRKYYRIYDTGNAVWVWYPNSKN